MKIKVRWSTLFPDEFLIRLSDTPIVYLPMGICEPHGHLAVLGLDTIKADYLCDKAAAKFGGIVAPTQGYQIHETGYHASWLEEVQGNVNPLMTSMPPHILLYFFLYQLRCFHNAGFKAAIIITGHSGGNQNDFRLAANLFEQHSEMKVIVLADPELVADFYEGDHAGRYEISQLAYINSELVRAEGRITQKWRRILGRFAQGEDATRGKASIGKDIMSKSLSHLKLITDGLKSEFKSNETLTMGYGTIEEIWNTLNDRKDQWETSKPKSGQNEVSADSIWKKYEYFKL